MGSVFQKSGESQRGGKQQSKAAAGVKKGSELKRNSKPSAQGELCSKEWAANSKRTPKKGTKELRTRKGDDSATISQAGHDSQVSCANRAKVVKDNNTNWLTMCRYERTYTLGSLRISLLHLSYVKTLLTSSNDERCL